MIIAGAADGGSIQDAYAIKILVIIDYCEHGTVGPADASRAAHIWAPSIAQRGAGSVTAYEL